MRCISSSMLAACERRLLAFYLANATSSLHHRDREAAAIAEWVATMPGVASPDVHHLLLGVASASELEWLDFDHVAADRDHVERLLKGALDSGASGVNVLLHGPPGTSKTRFCKVLAERFGVTLFSVGESDEDGGDRVKTPPATQGLPRAALPGSMVPGRFETEPET